MTNKIRTKLYSMTPCEVYLQQVKGTFDAMRASNKGLDYIPGQLGGIFGQQTVLTSGVVLELTDFEVTE